MDKNLVKEMNVQINKEMFSGYLYLSMAAFFESENLPGFANWMTVQAGEELEHAMKFFKFLNEVGETVVLDAIEQPETKFGKPAEIFKQALRHEQYITGRINLLFKLALEVNDYPTQMFLQWFVNEQVEEEGNATAILESLKRVGDSGNGLMMMDRELGHRAAD